MTDPVRGNYLTENDIVWPAGWDSDHRQALIDKWEAIVERKLGSVFYIKDMTVKMDGNGRSFLPLEGKPPLLSIVSTTVDDALMDSTLIDFNENGLFIEGGSFHKGFQNVVIVGTWGWTTTPKAITDGVRILIQAELNPEQYEMVDFEKEDVGDVSQGRPLFSRITGIVEADKLLSPFKRRSISIGRV
jgi:hypothetical protein